jgi:hypothetical protein
MKRVIVVIMIVVAAWLTGAWATAQMPDELIYRGETLAIFTNPLESYFGRDNPRPEFISRVLCTACWRGYVATWKIENEKLYLVKMVEGSCSRTAPEIDVSKIFGRRPPIEAVWFSGVLTAPRGKLLSYVHMGYESRYEKSLLLTIDKGRLVREEERDNRK